MDVLNNCTYFLGSPAFISDPQICLLHGLRQEHGSFQSTYKDEFLKLENYFIHFKVNMEDTMKFKMYAWRERILGKWWSKNQESLSPPK